MVVIVRARVVCGLVKEVIGIEPHWTRGSSAEGMRRGEVIVVDGVEVGVRLVLVLLVYGR